MVKKAWDNEVRVLRWLWTLARRTAHEFLDDNCPNLAASIAYYVLFSIFPLTLGLVAVLGAFVDAEELEIRMIGWISPYWPGSAGFIEQTIHDLATGSRTMGALAVVGLFWSGTSLFAAVHTALNQAWDTEDRRPWWKQKLLELTIIGTMGLLLLGSFVLTGLVRALVALPPNAALFGMLAGSPVVRLVTWLFSLALTYTMFFLAYKVLPSATVHWREATIGALVAALLFEGAKQGFVFYLGTYASYNVVYGPLASVIVFLLWAYISALILLLGAEVASEAHRMWEE